VRSSSTLPREVIYASWSSREVSRVLLGWLVKAFVSEGDRVAVGLEETLSFVKVFVHRRVR
jgi:hypothetical protein